MACLACLACKPGKPTVACDIGPHHPLHDPSVPDQPPTHQSIHPFIPALPLDCLPFPFSSDPSLPCLVHPRQSTTAARLCFESPTSSLSAFPIFATLLSTLIDPVLRYLLISASNITMAGRYERVNTQDDDVDVSPSLRHARSSAPNSPPPSFHSRSSSSAAGRRRPGVPDPTLADAFDADSSDDDGDDEPDDRQRLVRGNSFPVAHGSPDGSSRPTPQNTNDAANSRVYGGGIQSDGVFSNMTARPERGEKVVEEAPPTYEQAAADAAPPYWETTILAPGLGGPDDVFIDGMPVGSIFSFIWNGMISMSFQLVGFLLTYLLHSTHAAKNGSRAGLGITLIQYGFYMKGAPESDGMGDPSDGYAQPPDPNSHDFDPNAVGTSGDDGNSTLNDLASSEWVAYILMIVGWFILIRAVSDYVRARRHEQLVLQSPDRGLGIPIIAEGEAAEHVV
ncbi:hypothetical protein F4780DRAFT_759821 [Xylariomycetidae sp. FL0641]|nr:hypothetical protein F4780DRAFT_759821 [Xylariomycetidae sp. FL0641]